MLSRGARQPALTLLPALSALPHCVQTGIYHEEKVHFCFRLLWRWTSLSTWDHLADVLLSSPGPRTLVELLQVGEGHGRTYWPWNITWVCSDSWNVIVTLEREETAFFSEEELEESICVKTGLFCSIQPGRASVLHHQLVLGKRPAQKSTDLSLQTPTWLPGLPHGQDVSLHHCQTRNKSRQSRPGPHPSSGIFLSCFSPTEPPHEAPQFFQPQLLHWRRAAEQTDEANPFSTCCRGGKSPSWGVFTACFSVVTIIIMTINCLGWMSFKAGSSSEAPSKLHRSLAQPGQRAKEVSPPVHG